MKPETIIYGTVVLSVSIWLGTLAAFFWSQRRWRKREQWLASLSTRPLDAPGIRRHPADAPEPPTIPITRRPFHEALWEDEPDLVPSPRLRAFLQGSGFCSDRPEAPGQIHRATEGNRPIPEPDEAPTHEENDEMLKRQMAVMALTAAGILGGCDAKRPPSEGAVDSAPGDATLRGAPDTAQSPSPGTAPRPVPGDVLDIVDEVMNQQYGRTYEPKLGCWVFSAELAGGDAKEYCMKPAAIHIVQSNGARDIYLLVASEQDLGDPDFMYSLVDPGLMGAFLIRTESPRSWKLVAATKAMDYGSASGCGCHDAAFVKLGPNYYGWKFESGGVWQGVAVYSHSIVAARGAEFEDLSGIPMVTEEDQNTTYEIRIDDSADTPVFPLIVTRNRPGTAPDVTRIDFDREKWRYVLPAQAE